MIITIGNKNIVAKGMPNALLKEITEYVVGSDLKTKIQNADEKSVLTIYDGLYKIYNPICLDLPKLNWVEREIVMLEIYVNSVEDTIKSNTVPPYIINLSELVDRMKTELTKQQDSVVIEQDDDEYTFHFKIPNVLSDNVDYITYVVKKEKTGDITKIIDKQEIVDLLSNVLTVKNSIKVSKSIDNDYILFDYNRDIAKIDKQNLTEEDVTSNLIIPNMLFFFAIA